MLAAPLILVVEDDRATTNYLVRLLVHNGYRVEWVPDGPGALDRVRADDVALVLLSESLPGLSGVEVARQICSQPGHHPPVIMLSVFFDLDRRLQGFAAGADDYVTRPFSGEELLARIKAILRRAPWSLDCPAGRLQVDERLCIDFDEHEIVVDCRRTKLWPTEYKLLRLLVEHAPRIVPFETILMQVWGPAYTDARHYVHLYVAYLRKKIETNPSDPRYIVADRGVGYRFAIVPGRDRTVASMIPESAQRSR
jgi:two-component system KDP operon response regulator KdpE